MWPVFMLQFNCEFLINQAREGIALIALYIYQFCTILSVLGFVSKVYIRVPRSTFDHVDVASIPLAIQL